MRDDREIGLGEALRAQAALRRAAGMAEERFPVAAFVGMVSDEVEALRAAGRSDAEIAELICGAGVEVRAEEIERFYATPEERGKGPV